MIEKYKNFTTIQLGLIYEGIKMAAPISGEPEDNFNHDQKLIEVADMIVERIIHSIIEQNKRN